MAIHAHFSYSVGLFDAGVLGPFRPGRVVRGLHVFAVVGAVGDPLFRLGAALWDFPSPPASEAEFEALLHQFFSGDRTGVQPDPYLVLPTGRDIFLPLQVEMKRWSYIAFGALTMDATGTYQGSVCAACGLGQTRSGKRRGRTIQVFS